MSTRHDHGGGHNPIHAAGRSGDDVRHSKEDALDDREFELLLEGARQLAESQYYYDADPQFLIYTLGRLGLRRGEVAHMRESWVNWREKQIEIPSHDTCDFGKNGAVCGYCRQLARQRVEIADDLSMEEALNWVWVPKTQAASREVYFGYDPRAELFIERYFSSEEYSRVEVSGTAINRRVHRAAELAPQLDPEPLSPHVLRATAATHLAGAGMDLLPMMQMFGWQQPATAEVYIGRSGVKTARHLDGLFSGN